VQLILIGVNFDTEESAESETAAAKELVSSENRDGLPMAINVVRGQIIDMETITAHFGWLPFKHLREW
jgi:hypothetical protein